MNTRALLLWVGGFIGIGLLYAAYKGNLNPIQAVDNALSSANPDSKTTEGLTPGSAGDTPINGVAGAQPATTTSGVVGAGVVQSGSVWYVADQYGNPVTPVDGAYQGLAANFIPNTVTV